jgi:hypothetical protein
MDWNFFEFVFSTGLLSLDQDGHLNTESCTQSTSNSYQAIPSKLQLVATTTMVGIF